MAGIWGKDIGMQDYSGLGPASNPWTTIGAEGDRSAALLEDVKYQRALDAENAQSSFSDSIASLKNILNPEEEEVDPFEAYLAKLDADAATLSAEEEAAAEAAFIEEQKLAPLTGPSGVDVDTGKFSGSPRAEDNRFSWGDAINPAFYGFGGKEGFSFENPLGGFGLDEANIFSGIGNLIKGGSNWFVGNPDTWGGKDSFEDYVGNNKWDAAKTGAKNLMYTNPLTLPIAIAMDTSQGTVEAASEAVDDPILGPAMDENTFFQSEDFLHEGDQLGSIDRQREINMLDQDMDIDIEDYPYWYKEDDHHGSIAGQYVDERGYATGGRVGYAIGGRVGLQTGGIPWTQYMTSPYATSYYNQFNDPTLSSLPGITGDGTTGSTTTDPGNIPGNTPEEVIPPPLSTPIPGATSPYQFGPQGGGGAGPDANAAMGQMGYTVDSQGNLVASSVPSHVTSINVGDPAPSALQFGYDVVTGLPTLGNLAYNALSGLFGQQQPSTLGTITDRHANPAMATDARENAISGNVPPSQANYTDRHANAAMAASNVTDRHPNQAMAASNVTDRHPNPAMRASNYTSRHPNPAMAASAPVTDRHPNPAMAASNVTDRHSNAAMAAQPMPSHLGLQALDSSQVTSRHPNQAMKAGIASIPADQRSHRSAVGYGKPGNFGAAEAAANAMGFEGAVGHTDPTTGKRTAVTDKTGKPVGFGKKDASESKSKSATTGNKSQASRHSKSSTTSPSSTNTAREAARSTTGKTSKSTSSKSFSGPSAKGRQGSKSKSGKRGSGPSARGRQGGKSKSGKRGSGPSSRGRQGGGGGGGSCFVKGMPVEMLNGNTKPIEQIQVGDQTKGGEVWMTMIGSPQTIYNYLGVEVSGSHFVKENNKWIEVADSIRGIRTDKVEKVYTMNTTGNRIFIKGVEFTDYNGVSHNDPLDTKFYDDVMNKLNSEIHV